MTIYNSNTDTVKLSTEDTLKMICESTHRIIDALEDGERIKMRDLMDKVADETKIRTSSVEAFVPSFAYSHQNSYIKKGRLGGVVKGVEHAKIIKPRCPTCNQVCSSEASLTAIASVNQSSDEIEFITPNTPISEFTITDPKVIEPEIITDPMPLIEEEIASIPNDIANFVFGDEDMTNE